ncbi:hypothetical protein BHU72_05505 [Desulfuribacillus stibiiarsenatis]|uniref:Uncharacterized protein n=1 Tax=Desulfuribacillus stibiiarsenatis TaxID=1390249 RepID=A0A1E5L4L0_9FIRM|nr:hypothetical protein [Desulfuribacillus stibiiarsenatis]OEH85067.1 hypothetical protein BHU72_05505 [Desulfuribacillus stibiiarsenatis]
MQLDTKYGNLRGVSLVHRYPNGAVEDCTLAEKNVITIGDGKFVPQYIDDGVRRKYTRSVSFYEDGSVKSIVLQQKQVIQTSVGILPVEHIIFYSSGNVKRVFPLNGKITGYWTEDDEYELAEELSFDFPFGKISGKIIGIYFYDGGDVKSLTFWPKQRFEVLTPVGLIRVRYGLSVYPDGSLKTVEPAVPTTIMTPIGPIQAFDSNAHGINADVNSLVFHEDGRLKALTTSLHRIEITDKQGNLTIFEPSLTPNLFNPEQMDINPLRIEFDNEYVRVNGESIFDVNDTNIEVTSFTVNKKLCSSCSNCTACG